MESGIAVILPNMLEFIPMLIAFIIVAIILGKFGWPLFNDMLETRAKKIQDDLKSAEDTKVEAERVLQKNTDQIEEARDEAKHIVGQAKENAQTMADKIESDAKTQADIYTEKGKKAVEVDKKKAIDEISESAIDISMSAVAKFVSSDLDDETHRKIIERYVKEAASLA